MIQAYLMTASGAKRMIHQTTATIVIEGDKLVMEPSGEAAHHERHVWDYQGEKYVVLKINTPVLVRLKSGESSETLGPYPEMWLVDGFVLTAHQPDNALAHFDFATKKWIRRGDRAECDAIIFTQA